MAVPRAELLATAHRFMESYHSWDMDKILSVRSPNCIHHCPPKSLHGGPSYTNAEFAAFFSNILPLLRNFRGEVVGGGDKEESFVVDVERRKVAMHLRGYADSDIGPYENEYIVVLKMTERGDLVEEIVEFLDSGYTEKFFGKLQAAHAKGGEE
jgi:hypothetical protein